MTIKIKAPRAYYYDAEQTAHVAIKGGTHRIVRESDWRKLMRLVKLVELADAHPEMPWIEVENALKALSKEKKK